MQTIQFKVNNTLLDSIKLVLSNLAGIKDLYILKENETPQNLKDILYFKSLEDEYIYSLVELDGELRKEKLNIDISLYKNKEKAKEWRNNLMNIIHPDKSNHPNATKASEILNELYTNMIKNAK